MAWIELHQAVWTHRKTFQLADALDLDETYAAAHVIRLWTWALDNAPEGALADTSPRVIARASGWAGDAEVFLSALVSSGWLDQQGDTYRIHDWDDYAGRLIERRRQDADRLRRWRETHKDETRTKPVSNGVTLPDPTGPNPTEGSPSGVLAQQQLARRRATAAASEEIPEKFSATDEILRECRGYQPSARLWERIDRDYGGIDLEREALKLASWLAEHPKRTASARQILNWLDVAAKRQAEALATGPPRAAPGTNTEGWLKASRARGPTPPSGNGAYHGDGSELARAMAQERAEQAKRMQEAMAKRE